MQGHRTLIINPTKNDTYTRLEPHILKGEVYQRVLRSDPTSFRPLLIEADHIRRLINSVEYTVTGIGGFVGRQVETYEEACAYIDSVAEQIYKTNLWTLKLIRNEVKLGKSDTYGLICKDEQVVQQIQEDLRHIATVRVNPVKAVTKKNSKETNTETTEETNKESTDV